MSLIESKLLPRTAQHGSSKDGYRAWIDNHIIERVVEYPWALKFLKNISGNKLLDIGPGPFFVFPQILQYLNYNVVVSDINPSAERIVYDDICKSNLPGDSFDAVFCISVLPHFYDKLASMQHMKRVLKSDGIVVLTSGYSKESGTKTSRGYVSLKAGKNVSGCAPVYKKELDEWLKLFSKTLDIVYWKAWTKGWYLGERLPFPIECNEKEAQLIGVALKK